MKQKQTIGSVRIAIALVAILLWPAPARTQDVTGPALTAAFIYNMAKFTEWPPESPNVRPFAMCVFGDDAVGDALERIVKGRLVANNSISVVRLTSAGSQQVCHILYVSGVTNAQASQLIGRFRSAPVLTISNIEGFTGLGGMVQFFYEQGQLRFSIGLDSARTAGLQISAKILLLADRK